jgi:hypothetical protein
MDLKNTDKTDMSFQKVLHIQLAHWITFSPFAHFLMLSQLLAHILMLSQLLALILMLSQLKALFLNF